MSDYKYIHIKREDMYGITLHDDHFDIELAEKVRALSKLEFQRSLLELYPFILPPIENFFGNTPLRNWINKLPALPIPFLNTKRFGGQAMAYFYHNFFMIDGRKPNIKDSDEAFFNAFLNNELYGYRYKRRSLSPMLMLIGAGSPARASISSFLTAQHGAVLIHRETDDEDLLKRLKAIEHSLNNGASDLPKKIEEYMDFKIVNTLLNPDAMDLKTHPKPWESNNLNKGGKKNKKNRKW